MCGIFGIVAKEGNIAQKLLIIARRLQYRGYDSLGLATYLNGKIDLRKDMGTVESVVESLKLDKMKGNIGIDKDLAKFGDTVTNFIYSLAKSIVLGKLDQRKVSRIILSAALKQSKMKMYAKTRSDAHGLADTTEAFIGYMYCIGWSLESMADILKNYDLNDFKIEKSAAIEAFTHLLLKIITIFQQYFPLEKIILQIEHNPPFSLMVGLLYLVNLGEPSLHELAESPHHMQQ